MKMESAKDRNQFLRVKTAAELWFWVEKLRILNYASLDYSI